LWHQRLGHPDKKVIKYLKEITLNIHLSDLFKSDEFDLYETCHIVNTNKQISRRPIQTKQISFNCLY
ncbi:GAG-pre-integrase domain-containing protein, partial [Aspergillus neoniger CBS 115656]